MTKVTIEEVHAAITQETYTVLPNGRTTVCQLTLKNGFTVEGQSACVSASEFKKELGEQYAKEQAIDKVWAYLGWDLASRLSLIENAGAPDAGLVAVAQALDQEPKTYVGTKVIHAFPLSRGDYCRLKGWEVPANENPDDSGYVVAYADGGSPNVDFTKHYVSWTPTDVFEAAYNPGVTIKQTTHVERMFTEFSELNTRIQKLGSFLGSPQASSVLSARDRDDMEKQHRAMIDYRWHLGARMKRQGHMVPEVK